MFEKWDEGMVWIDLVWDRDWLRALVNAVMNRRVPQNAKISYSTRGSAGSQKEIHSMELFS
jgi:hypothetical protein